MYRKNLLDLDRCIMYTNSDYKYGKMKTIEIITIANILDYYKIYNFANFDEIEKNYNFENSNKFKNTYKTIRNIAKKENYKCKIKKHLYKSFNKVVENIDNGFPMVLEHKDLKYGRGISVIVGYLEEDNRKEIKLLTGRDLDSEVWIPWEKENLNKICTVCI